MSLKTLAKANKILEQVKLLDSEIIELDRCALLMANGEVTVDLSLGIIDLAKKKEKEKVGFDSDGSLVYNPLESMYRMSGLLGSYWRHESPKEENKTEYKAAISETIGLQVLGVLLCEKQNRRLELLEKLKQMGFQ